MAERCALFIIIALGESILVTGATFAGLAWTGAESRPSRRRSSAVGHVVIYFDTGQERGTM